jgi:hypothetical protein
MKYYFVPNFGLIVTIYQKNKGNMHQNLKEVKPNDLPSW